MYHLADVSSVRARDRRGYRCVGCSTGGEVASEVVCVGWSTEGEVASEVVCVGCSAGGEVASEVVVCPSTFDSVGLCAVLTLYTRVALPRTDLRLHSTSVISRYRSAMKNCLSLRDLSIPASETFDQDKRPATARTNVLNPSFWRRLRRLDAHKPSHRKKQKRTSKDWWLNATTSAK